MSEYYEIRTNDGSNVIFKTLQSALTRELSSLTAGLITSSSISTQGGVCTFVFIDDDTNDIDENLDLFSSQDEPMIRVQHYGYQMAVIRQFDLIEPKIISREYTGTVDGHNDAIHCEITLTVEYKGLKRIPVEPK